MSKVVIKRKNASKSFHKGQKGLDAKIALVEKGTMTTEFPDFKAGDNVKVSVKIKEGDKERVQAYEGLVIAMSGKGASKSPCVGPARVPADAVTGKTPRRSRSLGEIATKG